MNFVDGNNLCSFCTGKSCEPGRCQYYESEERTKLQSCSSLAQQCQSKKAQPPGDKSPRNSNRERGQGGVKVRDTSLGFELHEEGASPLLLGIIMSEKENMPVYDGEVTPEQPERRTKGTPAGLELKPSPFVTHGNSNTDHANRLWHKDRQGLRPHSPSEETCSSPFPSPFQSQHAQGHHHGNTCRSDTYLRQALASPYNQRGQKHAAVTSTHCSDGRSGSKEASLVYSPSLWREGVGQIQSSPHRDRTPRGLPPEGLRQGSAEPGSGLDQHTTFKTPCKSTSSPERCLGEAAVSGNASPSSWASGGSGSGSGPHTGPQNPFEVHHDRLHFPLFSPNMFTASHTPGSAEKETFQWNIEHLAELRPVHIDDKDIKRQLSKQWRDEEAEQRAQKAIDYYFQHHMVAPSPWSEAPPPHVLPVTPCGPGYDDLMATTPNQAQGSIQKDLPHSKRSHDKSCQTTLTLPLSLDLEKILGEYMTYQDSERDESMGMSSSSLRRKLFFNADSSSVVSPVRTGPKSPDHLSAALNTPPNCRSTPQWDRGSPLHTPSSVQFSSSPIRGLLTAEGDNFRSSFSEHGPLASPELSPIADRHRGRFRQSLGFPPLDGDVDHEADLGFGSPIRKQLQMEVHDGSSPRERPSPDVSPIAAFGSDGSGHQSRSRTLRADMSQSLLPSSPHLSSPHQHPHPTLCPDPVPEQPAVMSQRTTSSASLSMDTDTLDLCPTGDREAATLSLQDSSSLTELMSAEGERGGGSASGLDTDPWQQHPSSASYPDTGYQTGSGNGSLQTTQDGAVSMTTSASASTEAPCMLTDPGPPLARLAARLQGGGEQGPTLTATTSLEGRAAGRLWPDDCSADGMGTWGDPGQVTHSNLTNQFMSLPVHAELSSSSADLQTSLVALTQSPWPLTTEGLLPVLEDRTGRKDAAQAGATRQRWMVGGGESVGSSDCPQARHAVEKCAAAGPHSSGRHQPSAGGIRGRASVSVADRDEDAGAELSQGALPSPRDGSEDDDQGLTLNSYLHRHNADFLNKMGDYLEKGGELSDDGLDRGENRAAPSSSSSSPLRALLPVVSQRREAAGLMTVFWSARATTWLLSTTLKAWGRRPAWTRTQPAPPPPLWPQHSHSSLQGCLPPPGNCWEGCLMICLLVGKTLAAPLLPVSILLFCLPPLM
ncbi:hypothetical protein ACOMHN_000627 [Nucella lapillus]